MLSASVQVLLLTYGFSESVEKPCLIAMVTAPPPPKCPLKRGLVYHLCSRLNNMSVIGIRTTPSQLLLVQDGAPSLTPTPPLSQHPPPMSSLPSSTAVNNEWFPNCLSRFLLLTSDTGKTVPFHSVTILEDFIWRLIVELFNGRNLLICCFSYPVSSCW